MGPVGPSTLRRYGVLGATTLALALAGCGDEMVAGVERQGHELRDDLEQEAREQSAAARREAEELKEQLQDQLP